MRPAGGMVAIAFGAPALVGGCGLLPTGSLLPGCQPDRITGILEPLGPSGSLGLAVGNEHLILEWGDGTRTVVVNGRLSVLSPAGIVTGHVGDEITLTGGRTRPGVITACSPAAP